MFEKYAYFYDIPHEIMNVIIYYAMNGYNMVSSRLMKEKRDICRLFQKHDIQTVREGVYLSKFYDMNCLCNIGIIDKQDFAIGTKITELDEKSV